MMRRLGAPIIRPASMNSFCFSESTWPRTRRAIVTQLTMASATKSSSRPFINWPMGVSRSDTITMMKNSRSGNA